MHRSPTTPLPVRAPGRRLAPYNPTATVQYLAVAGDWGSLVARLDRTARLDLWGQLEPALAGQGLPGLREQLRPGVDPHLADEVLGALVRLAAADGHDELDAVLVLLHLLADGARALAARLHDLSGDMPALVVGELAAQIRAFPWQRRHRAYAANLLLDTKAALMRELRPHRTRAHPDAREVLVDPTDPAQLRAMLDDPVTPTVDGDLHVIDVLAWAGRTGILGVDDIELLLQVERRREQPGTAQQDLARSWGISERTLRRRRERALTALRHASGRYLSDCA